MTKNRNGLEKHHSIKEGELAVLVAPPVGVSSGDLVRGREAVGGPSIAAMDPHRGQPPTGFQVGFLKLTIE